MAGFVLRLTGLSGSGKTTIAQALHTLIQQQHPGRGLQWLDGDVVRESLTKDLGFTRADRMENIHRVSFVADLLSQHGVGVIATFVSPYVEMRTMLRDRVHNYIEVFVDTPLVECQRRDPKGLYQQVQQGQIKHFTGVDDPFDPPVDPDIHLRTTQCSIEESVQTLYQYLQDHAYLS